MPDPVPSYLPYCGLPALPAGLWSSWNLDPVLIAAFGLAAAAYAWRSGIAIDAGRKRRAWAFYAGWAITLLALVSPLCALSVALFSARVTQHMVLLLLAAPLLVIGWPDRRAEDSGKTRSIAQGPGWRGRLERGLSDARCAWLAFAAALWFWHAPGPYAASFSSDLVYWAMHASLFGAALMLWRVLLAPGAAAKGMALACAVSTAVHMGILGALLTFGTRPLYIEHLDTASAWGLSALEDQQLGGLIMWVPGCGAFLLAAMFGCAAWWQAMQAPPAAVSSSQAGRQ